MLKLLKDRRVLDANAQLNILCVRFIGYSTMLVICGNFSLLLAGKTVPGESWGLVVAGISGMIGYLSRDSKNNPATIHNETVEQQTIETPSEEAPLPEEKGQAQANVG